VIGNLTEKTNYTFQVTD